MTKLRILIADDEPLARERIRSLLLREPGLGVIGECENGPDAAAAIRHDAPDIVFLDVQMPGYGGLQVVADLPAEPRPAIIFVTAHERFAVDAFAANAVDYLLKPFDQERLLLALKRAIDHLQARRAGDLGQRIELLLAASAGPRGPERLTVRSEGRVVFLTPAEIIWVEAANNYSILHLADTKRLMLRETLLSLEKRLGPLGFARINRSALVRVDQIKELQPATYGDYVVLLRNGQRLSLSRNLRGQLGKFVPGGL